MPRNGSRRQPPSSLPFYSLGNVNENVIAAFSRCDKSVSLVSAEALHDALDEWIPHGPIRAAKTVKTLIIWKFYAAQRIPGFNGN